MGSHGVAWGPWSRGVSWGHMGARVRTEGQRERGGTVRGVWSVCRERGGTEGAQRTEGGLEGAWGDGGSAEG
eukprot:7009280-Prymnesium_polylepis.1